MKKLVLAMLVLSGCSVGRITPATECDVARAAFELAEALCEAFPNNKDLCEKATKVRADVERLCGTVE